MQKDKVIVETEQLDRIIKSAETLANVLQFIEDRASLIHDTRIDGYIPVGCSEQELLEKMFEIIKDSGVFNVQRIAMLSLLISIINE